MRYTQPVQPAATSYQINDNTWVIGIYWINARDEQEYCDICIVTDKKFHENLLESINHYGLLLKVINIMTTVIKSPRPTHTEAVELYRKVRRKVLTSELWDLDYHISFGEKDGSDPIILYRNDTPNAHSELDIEPTRVGMMIKNENDFAWWEWLFDTFNAYWSWKIDVTNLIYHLTPAQRWNHRVDLANFRTLNPKTMGHFKIEDPKELRNKEQEERLHQSLPEVET